MKELTNEQMSQIIGGEVITLTAVLALLAAAVIAVVVYKLFISDRGGKVELPGGWKFQWD